jgi:hypothetical protein
MDAPGDALFQDLKTRFLAGVSRPDAATLRTQAAQLLEVLAQHGTAASASLPDGVFWQGA